MPVNSTSADWKERASLSLEQQWALAQDLLALGRRILSHYAGQTQPPTPLAQVERILQLATRLARLSEALPPDAPLVDQIPEPALTWEG